LHGDDIPRFELIAFGEKLALGRSLKKLGRDPHAIASAHHGTL
jgi:hypothetical protein